jgi:hypothetical protein
MEPDSDDIFADMDRWVEAYRRNKKLRQEHPYVGDLIGALKGFKNGRPRRRVIEVLEQERKSAGLPIPKHLESAVQATYNNFSSDSLVFRKRSTSGEKALFYAPGGSGSGSGAWALYEANALEWLKNNMRLEEEGDQLA